MLVGIISQPSSITCLIPPGTAELWPLNFPKTELAVSALQVQYPASKNVVITIEFTTNILCFTNPLCSVLSLKIFNYTIDLNICLRLVTCI